MKDAACVRGGASDLDRKANSAIASIPCRRSLSQAYPSIDCPRFRWTVDRIHDLGPRSLGELLVEIDADPAVLDNYARMIPSLLKAVGGDRWPVAVFAVST